MKRQTMQQLKSTGFTRFIEMRKCMNCEKILDTTLSKCSECGMILFEPANEEEITEFMELKQKTVTKLD